MSVNFKLLIALLFLCLSLAFNSVGQAQDKKVVKPDFGDGALEETSVAMGRLLQLKWNGQNLELKQDWDERLKEEMQDDEETDDADAGDVDTGDEDEDTAAADIEDKVKKSIERLADAGLPEAKARRMAERMAEAKARMAEGRARMAEAKAEMARARENRPEVQKAFLAVQAKFATGPSIISGGDISRIMFSSESLCGLAILEEGNVRFEFTEIQKNKRNFKIADDGKGRFKFEFGYDDLLVRLNQAETGKTQLFLIDGDQVEVFEGDSFSDFMRRNPKVTDEMLFPLFKRLGIGVPASKPAP